MKPFLFGRALSWLHYQIVVPYFQRRPNRSGSTARPHGHGKKKPRGALVVWCRRYLWRELEANSKDDGDDYTSHDARFAGRTLIEKKKLIIQREINKQGFGKYQV